MKIKVSNVNTPNWKDVNVKSHIPVELEKLSELARNIWWSWNYEATELFKDLDPVLWKEVGQNPVLLLERMSYAKLEALAKDKVILRRMEDVYSKFRNYMDVKPDSNRPSVAYFSMEYGLNHVLKIYSGGLGVLAGDYLKEASDSNVDLCAVGFLYRYGYFTQTLAMDGQQIANYEAQNFGQLPIDRVLDENGNQIVVDVPYLDYYVHAFLWRVNVGRISLYLLDTDNEMNSEFDRSITHQLYGGDWENRLKQEILLGIGGILTLKKLGIKKDVYHCNEGHAALINVQRICDYVAEGLTYDQAIELVRASSLYTVHTPVPAGHDAFDEGLLRKYIGHYPQRLKIDWETMMGLGKVNGNDVNEKFSMSFLAANLSQNVNGVSMLHGDVSKEIFSSIYPGYLPEELFISYVTNGVHYPTWAAAEWKKIHARVFGPEFATHHYDKSCFEGIYKVADTEIWETRKALKKRLINIVKERISDPSQCNHYSPSQIVAIKENLRDDVLTIGFARRFATYKRGTLLFSDLDRLDAIVNDPVHPVQFLFAGKAHPADKAGQDLIKRIIEISKQDRFIGKIVFIPGYDISLAKRLVQGVDVWMNNPTRPLEASGTSGEKASMNGVMHFSVLDGWWVEGYKPGAGWALPLERTYDDQNYQNELDAATIYTTIENEIAPAYYDVDKSLGLSPTWVGYIKNTIAQVANNFTTNRMLTDYCDQYYIPQSERAGNMVADDYKMARVISAWKKKARREWQNVEVISQTQPDPSYSLTESNALTSEVVLNLGDLSPQDIGVEMLFATTDVKHQLHIQEKCDYEVVEFDDGVAKYRASILPDRTGMYQVAVRMFAKNPLLPHRQDFELVKWL